MDDRERASRTVQKYRFPVVLLLGLLVSLLIIWLYRTTFSYWVTAWRSGEGYSSHAPLVAVVSAFLIWQKRGWLKLAAYRSRWECWRAWGLLLGVLTLKLVGDLLHINTLQGVSLPLLLMGILFVLCGSTAFKALLFPLAFLLFLVPMPLLGYYLGYPLQEKASVLAASLGSLMGVAVQREGTLLKLANGNVLLVSEACSGLRSSLALLATALLVAYRFRLNFRRGFLLTLLALPMALLANALRLVVSVLVANAGWSVAQNLLLHGGTDFLLFATQAAGLVLIARRFPVRPDPDRSDKQTVLHTHLPARRTLLLVLLLALVNLLGESRLDASGSAEMHVTRELPIPLQVGEWSGVRVPVSPGVTHYYHAQVVRNDYVCDDGMEVELFLVYRGDSPIVHPSVGACLPGDGWDTLEKRTISTQVDLASAPQRVRRLWLRRENAEIVVLFWYQLGSRWFSDSYAYRWREIWYRLAGRRTTQMFVRLTTPLFSLDHDRVEQQTTHMLQFWEILWQKTQEESHMSTQGLDITAGKNIQRSTF